MNLPQLKNKSFLEQTRFAKQIVQNLSKDKLEDFKRDLQAKIDYLKKKALFSDSKKELDDMAKMIGRIYTSICFEEAKAYVPKPGTNQYKKVEGSTAESSAFYKERHYLKDIETEEQLESACKEVEEKGIVATPYTINKQKKEKKKKERIEAVKERKATKKSKEKSKKITLYNLPISELADKIEPNSVDVVFTDPPYQKQDLPLFSDLAHFSNKVLKPGGSLLCMTGSMYLPEVLDNLKSSELTYHWSLGYFMNGPTSRVISRSIFQAFKLVLWFVKGKYKGESINDSILCPKRSETSNELHKWGQSVEGMRAVLDKGFAFPSDVVCDPFVGAGSVAIACRDIGCSFIGSDIDAECIKITKGRLNEI